MKKLLAYTFVLILLGQSCRKSDNPKIPDLERVPVPRLSKDASSPVNIPVSTLDQFTAKINVDVLFKDDVPPKKMDLVITKNGDKSSVKVIKTDITVFPSAVTITGADLKTAFGTVQTCDYFDIGVNITTNGGKVYEAFPAVGSAYGAGVSGQYGGVQTSITYNTKVEYNSDVYSGDFLVVSDEFQDFVPGNTVKLTKISNTQFSFIQPAVQTPLPIILTVNPETLAVSVTKQKIGSFFLWEPTYTNPNVSTKASNPANRVLPCSQTLSVAFDYTVDQGGFGEYVLILKKK